MKKSKTIQLILITAALASCQEKKKEPEWGSGNKTYVRGDSTAPYTLHTMVEWDWQLQHFGFMPLDRMAIITMVLIAEQGIIPVPYLQALILAAMYIKEM